jgi:hypothetical protein
MRKLQHGFLKTNFERIEKKKFFFKFELGKKKNNRISQITGKHMRQRM